MELILTREYLFFINKQKVVDGDYILEFINNENYKVTIINDKISFLDNVIIAYYPFNHNYQKFDIPLLPPFKYNPELVKLNYFNLLIQNNKDGLSIKEINLKLLGYLDMYNKYNCPIEFIPNYNRTKAYYKDLNSDCIQSIIKLKSRKRVDIIIKNKLIKGVLTTDIIYPFDIVKQNNNLTLNGKYKYETIY